MSSVEVIHKQSVAEYMDPFKIWKTAGLWFVDVWKHAIHLMGLNKDLVQAGKSKMFSVRKQSNVVEISSIGS